MSPLAITNLSQARTRRLIERAAYLQHHINRSQEELDTIKDQFKAFGDGQYDGSAHRITVTTSTTTRLDAKLVRGCLTPAEIIDCSVSSDSTRVLIKEI